MDSTNRRDMDLMDIYLTNDSIKVLINGGKWSKETGLLWMQTCLSQSIFDVNMSVSCFRR